MDKEALIKSPNPIKNMEFIKKEIISSTKNGLQLPKESASLETLMIGTENNTNAKKYDN